MVNAAVSEASMIVRPEAAGDTDAISAVTKAAFHDAFLAEDCPAGG
jgi:hypothetical protein